MQFDYLIYGAGILDEGLILRKTFKCVKLTGGYYNSEYQTNNTSL